MKKVLSCPGVMPQQDDGQVICSSTHACFREEISTDIDNRGQSVCRVIEKQEAAARPARIIQYRVKAIYHASGRIGGYLDDKVLEVRIRNSVLMCVVCHLSAGPGHIAFRWRSAGGCRTPSASVPVAGIEAL